MRPKKVRSPAYCEYKPLTGSPECGKVAVKRVMVEQVDPDDYHNRILLSDRYLCKDHVQ